MAKKIQQYHIVWEVELDATSPKEAALKAEAHQHKYHGVFDVTSEKGKTTRVDLAE